MAHAEAWSPQPQNPRLHRRQKMQKVREMSIPDLELALRVVQELHQPGPSPAVPKQLQHLRHRDWLWVSHLLEMLEEEKGHSLLQ